MIDDPNMQDKWKEDHSYYEEKYRADKQSKKQFWIIFFLLVLLLPLIQFFVN